MITDKLMQLLDGLLTWALSVRPSWDVHLPAGVTGVIQFLLGLDAILPVSEVLLILSLTVSLVVALTSWKWSVKLVDWIADVIP